MSPDDNKIHLRFPEELPVENPVILFEAKEWSIFRMAYKDTTDTNYKKESKGSVALYLPSITENHTVQWDSAQNYLTHGMNMAADIIGAMPLGKVAVDFVKLNQNIAVSQDSIATFKDVENRKFTFSFNLIPSSRDETRTIKQIIDFFRFHSLPEYSAILINFPSIFYVSILGMGDGSGNNYFQFKPMALESLNVTYGDGEYMQLMVNNTPAKVKIDLTFQEVTKPYKGDFKYADSRMQVKPTNQTNESLTDLTKASANVVKEGVADVTGK